MSATSSLAEADATLLYRWFILYNPLYIFSALCVLSGVYLLAEDLPGLGAGQVILFAIIQAYELFVLAGAAFVHRQLGQTRPAVTLGVLALLFWFDPTLRTDGLATVEGLVGPAFSLLWIALTTGKLWTVAWIFRLAAPIWYYGLLMLGPVMIAVDPYLMTVAGADRGHVLLTGGGLVVVFAALTHWLRPPITSRESLDAWGETVLKRATAALAGMWIGFAYMHMITWMGIYDIPWSARYLLPPFLLVLIMVKEEQVGWLSAAGFVLFVRGHDVPLLSGLVALVLLGKAWFEGKRNFYVATMLLAYWGIWHLGYENEGLPEPKLWLNLFTAAGLLFAGWRFNLVLAFPGAALAMMPGITSLVPQDRRQLGVLLVVLAFLTLGAGIAVTWLLSRRPPLGNSGPPVPLTACSSCHREVQESLQVCPHCGADLAKKSARRKWGWGDSVGLVMIIGVLAAIAIPNFMVMDAKARQSEARVNLGGIFTSASAMQGERKTFVVSNVSQLGFALSGVPRYSYWYSVDGVPVMIPLPQGSTVGKSSCDVTTPPTSVKVAASATGFTAAAKGNIDRDAACDEWSINEKKELRHTLDDTKD